MHPSPVRLGGCIRYGLLPSIARYPLQLLQRYASIVFQSVIKKIFFSASPGIVFRYDCRAVAYAYRVVNAAEEETAYLIFEPTNAVNVSRRTSIR